VSASIRFEKVASRPGISTKMFYRPVPTKENCLDKMMIGYLDRIASRISAGDRLPEIAVLFYRKSVVRPIVLPARFSAHRERGHPELDGRRMAARMPLGMMMSEPLRTVHWGLTSGAIAKRARVFASALGRKLQKQGAERQPTAKTIGEKLGSLCSMRKAARRRGEPLQQFGAPESRK
jgi:hypothetical protein